MTSLNRFSLFDIFEYSPINVDIFTETFSACFYGKYINKWKDCCFSIYNNGEKMIGYMIGKVEGVKEKKEWHGHISAVTIYNEYRG